MALPPWWYSHWNPRRTAGSTRDLTPICPPSYPKGARPEPRHPIRLQSDKIERRPRHPREGHLRTLRTLIVAAIAALCQALPAAAQAVEDEAHEFFFTRGI